MFKSANRSFGRQFNSWSVPMQSSLTSFPAQSHSSAVNAQADGSRQLNDEVLQSAEDAFLLEASAPGVDSYSVATSGPVRSTNLHTLASGSGQSSYQKAVGRYVAANPFQSALMAAATGALAAMLLRFKLRRRPASRR
jgi:hypothetical protein